MTVVTLLFLTGLFEKLPEATLAAVVIAAVIELVDVPTHARASTGSTRGASGEIYGHAARADFIAALAAHARRADLRHVARAVHRHRVVADAAAVPGVEAARRRARRVPRVAPDQFTDIERHPENEASPAVAVCALEAGLFFANAEAVRPR